MKIKSPAVAGKFYTDNKEELINQLNKFEKQNTHDYKIKSRAIIVPHAGYIYSGQLASCGFQYLDNNVKNIFIIAPPHQVPVGDIALSNFDKWATPLGKIEVNQKINQELIKDFGCRFDDEAFEFEHSAEVQVPFIQKNFKNVKIIPILAGNPDKVKQIISHYYEDEENAFVISSDLSHFFPSSEAKKLDLITSDMIETKNVANFNSKQACGVVGILGLLGFAIDKKYSLIRVGLYNSGDTTGDNSSVVGYGSWLLYEGEKNEFVKKYFSNYVIEICKKSILSKLEQKDLELNNISNVLMQSGASFVTLEKKGDLRGCIGSIIAHRTLVDDLAQNARSSAFADPRFNQLERNEFNELSINISLLSSPEKMEFKNEADLLSQIKPNIDGIIIKDQGYQAVYLPSVWEQLPDKVQFLNSLKMKAGLSPKHFSNTFEAFRYTTEYIKE